KLRRGWGVGVPEFGLFVVGVEKDGVVAVLVGEAAEGVVAGGVIAGAAGECAGGVFFARAFGSAVDVEPDHRVALVDELFGMWSAAKVLLCAASRSCQRIAAIWSSVALASVTRVMELSVVWKTRKGGGATVGR